jgi:hypothetical protein
MIEMTVSHTWNVASLGYADASELSSVINQIKWVCVSDDGAGHTWYSDGTKHLGAPDPDSFSDFDTLTEADVLVWLGDGFIAEQEAAHEAAIQMNIDAETSSAGVGVPW